MNNSPYDLNSQNRPKIKSLSPFADALIRKQIRALEKIMGIRVNIKEKS